MTLRRRRPAAVISVLALSACGLDVTPPPRPSVADVFDTPAAIEQTILTGYQSCRSSLVASTIAQTIGLSLQGTGDALRSAIPREVIANSPGSAGFYNDYLWLGTGARLTANAVRSLDALKALNGTLGSAQQDLRARAFGYFNIGCHQGWLAMLYDSAAVITPFLHPDTIPALRAASVVMDSAIAMFDSAIAAARRADTVQTGGFPLPATWLNSTGTLTRGDFIRFVRSFRARFRAGVARTPQQRALVNWPAVIADADSGITADYIVNVTNSQTGLWFGGQEVGALGVMHLPPFYYAMADTSGGYSAWLAVPLAQRDTFLIVTPDRRWPQGTTRAAQQAASVIPTSHAGRPYLRNRSNNIVWPRYLNTHYQWVRNEFIRTAPLAAGPYLEITKAEMNLLAAEGHLYAGNIGAAAPLIDITRVGRGQLPALTGVITSATQPVPGAGACVPRVPQGPAFTSTACGTILEALKYEKRMETAFTGHSQWFFDSRGWGDLPENSAFEFPVPHQELSARRRPYYSVGGGLRSSAARGTYGF